MRYNFGGGSSDFVYSTVQGPGYALLASGAATVTFWNAATGGTRYTDLLVNGAAATSVVADARGRILPGLQGPDGVTEMWADTGGSTRVLVSSVAPRTTRIGVIHRGHDPESLFSEGIITTPIPTDGTSDCATALNQIPANTGKVHLRGTFQVASPMTVQHHTQIVGVDRVNTKIKALAGFTGATVVQLGQAAALAFDTRLTDLCVDGNGLVNAAVTAGQIQEMCGLERVLLTGFKTRGWLATNGFAQNYGLVDVEAYPNPGAAAGVTCMEIGTGGARVIQNVTVIPAGAVGTAAPASSVGILLGGPANLLGIHVEGATVGVKCAGATGSTIAGASGIGGTGIVGALVQIVGAQDNITLTGISPKGSTLALDDQYHGVTYAGWIGFYTWGGGGAGADSLIHNIAGVQQRVYGPLNVAGNSTLGAVGFNGAAPVGKAAATADATDLASAITLVNALKANLQALGLKN